MSSMIFVLREVIEGEELLPAKDLNCVTEEELRDYLLPRMGDYLYRIVDQESFDSCVKWLATESRCLQVTHEEGQTFVTLDLAKGLELLKSKLKWFLELVGKLNEEEWCSPFSQLLSDIGECIEPDFEFFIVTISDDLGWFVYSFDEWLRSHCGPYIDLRRDVFVRFRVEDIFNCRFLKEED